MRPLVEVMHGAVQGIMRKSERASTRVLYGKEPTAIRVQRKDTKTRTIAPRLNPDADIINSVRRGGF